MRKLFELGTVTVDTRASSPMGETKDGAKAFYAPVNNWVFLKVRQDSTRIDLAPIN